MQMSEWRCEDCGSFWRFNWARLRYRWKGLNRCEKCFWEAIHRSSVLSEQSHLITMSKAARAWREEGDA